MTPESVFAGVGVWYIFSMALSKFPDLWVVKEAYNQCHDWRCSFE